MLFNNGNLQKTWISKGAHAFMGNIWGCTQSIGEYFSLRERNDSLALENFRLRVRIAQMENKAGYMKVDSSHFIGNVAGDYRYTHASVIKMSTGLHHNYIILDKGAQDGVIEGTGVITGKGTIGIIDAVSNNYSYARSFLNSNTKVSARIGLDGSAGSLEWTGTGKNKAVLREIPHHIEFEKGDTIYTSGYSAIFPPDIPLGTIQDSKIVNGATHDINILLFEDFSALRYVTIVENISREEITALEDNEKK